MGNEEGEGGTQSTVSEGEPKWLCKIIHLLYKLLGLHKLCMCKSEAE